MTVALNALNQLHWWIWPILIAAIGVIFLAGLFAIIDWRHNNSDQSTNPDKDTTQ